MITVFLGVALIILAAFLHRFAKRAQNHLLEIRFMETSPVADIIGMRKSIADEIGTGGFKQLVEIKGIAGCTTPLKGELSGMPCVYYEMQVEERYEERYRERDAQGREVERTRTGSDIVASNKQSVPFFLEDNGHRIMIDPKGARMDLQKTVDRYEPSANAGARLNIGSFSLDLSTRPARGRRILGYHYSESLLPTGRDIFVIGEACDTRGDLTVLCPGDTEKPFIISLKSEEEIIKGMQTKARLLIGGAIICVIGGVALIVAGIV